MPCRNQIGSIRKTYGYVLNIGTRLTGLRIFGKTQVFSSWPKVVFIFKIGATTTPYRCFLGQVPTVTVDSNILKNHNVLHAQIVVGLKVNILDVFLEVRRVISAPPPPGRIRVKYCLDYYFT